MNVWFNVCANDVVWALLLQTHIYYCVLLVVVLMLSVTLGVSFEEHIAAVPPPPASSAFQTSCKDMCVLCVCDSVCVRGGLGGANRCLSIFFSCYSFDLSLQYVGGAHQQSQTGWIKTRKRERCGSTIFAVKLIYSPLKNHGGFFFVVVTQAQTATQQFYSIFVLPLCLLSSSPWDLGLHAESFYFFHETVQISWHSHVAQCEFGWKEVHDHLSGIQPWENNL